MRTLLLFFVVVLVHDGNRCLGYAIGDILKIHNHILLPNSFDEGSGEQYSVEGDDGSLVPEANEEIDEIEQMEYFLQKVKNKQKVKADDTSKADKCGYEMGCPKIPSDDPSPVSRRQGREGGRGTAKVCNVGKSEMLNVHLVPHSHDDVGWTKTVDEYYYGGGSGIQYVFDTVSHELLENPQRRFIYVEMAYFTRWWNEQEDATRAQVKGLVSTGRLEFILGGWSMNDEASTHYSSIIDQHTIGFRFLQQNFGECGRPRIGWQVDPFGHSREQASIFAQFGFDGGFLGRIDYQDFDKRTKEKNLEHMWMGSESLGDAATLFTSTLIGRYHYPRGFCFQCGDAPIRDDPRLENYNVDQRVDDFVNTVTYRAESFATNHIMLTMGADNHYANARVNFKNMDKLIKYVNMRQENGSKINAFYSTPSCYVYAMNQLNLTYTRKDDDFFPYANREHTFWTGHFSSRPTLKGYERTSNNFLQVCKQLETLSVLGPEHRSGLKVDILREALGVLQHHDALTGTEKQHVADDYAKMVSEGIAACEEVVNASYGKILPRSSSAPQLSIQFCPLANVSYCPASEGNKEFVVLIYNPIAREVDYFARIPVSGIGHSVKDATLKSVDAQVAPLPDSTYRIPDFTDSKATGELVFNAKLPALGFASFFVKASPDDNYSMSLDGRTTGDDVIIRNEFLSLTFNGKSGLLTGLTNTEKSLSVELSNELLYHKSYEGHNRDGENQASGPYVFRPDGNEPDQIAKPLPVLLASVVQGSEVQEVEQVFSDWASQVVRLYKGQRYVEIEWTVGPIPVEDDVGKEVISRFSSNLNSNKTFYTDSNGREILKRVRDYRPTWDLNQTEPVAGNYYPVNSRIFIQDVERNLQLTVLTDRSQGGASIKDGEIELMLHRRHVVQDSLGISEPLNELGPDGNGLIVRGKYYVILDTIDGSVRLHRDLAQRLYMAPSISFVQTNLTPDLYVKDYKTTWSGLKKSLPENVHLLTLEQWHSGKFLLRLEHFYQKDEDKRLSQVAEVNLKDLFVPFTIASVEEQTLGANQPLSKATRLQWNVQDYGRTTRDMSSFVKPVDPQDLIVQLKPMQIRTFHVTVNDE